MKALAFACFTIAVPAFSQIAEQSVAIRVPMAATAPTVVPTLVPYSGIALNADGKPITGETAITLSVYKDENGGEALWTEAQTVDIDANGHYQVRIGASAPSGVPPETFASGEARWLEVQVEGQSPQPRVLLMSVPYAMKAADAATLGGLPASAFMLAGQSSQFATNAVAAAVTPDAASTVTTTGGTSGLVPVFIGTATVGTSIIHATSTGVGIGNGPATGAALDVYGETIHRGIFDMARTGTATPSAGTPSNPFELHAQVYNTSLKGTLNPFFQMEAEPVGNNTASTGAALHLLYSTGEENPVETGFYFNPNGTIHFASGQTFPSSTGTSGTGTITAVKAGTDLTGGGSSGSVTLNVDTTKVATLTGNPVFTGIVTVNGNSTSAISATSSAAQTGAVQGTSSGSAGYGLLGTSTSTTAGYGVYGESNFGTGVFGAGGADSTMQGLIADYFANTAGVWGDSYGMPGVIGTSDVSAGGIFASSSGSFPALYALSNSYPSNQLYSFGAYDVQNAAGCLISTTGVLSCTGSVSAEVALQNGERSVQTYAVQSAENWFEDAGTVQLVNGAAHVDLEETFGQTVNTDVEYHVFLTPDGDCKGLYVANKTANGFDVHELGGGTSSIAFEYRIMAKRIGHENERLVDVTAAVKQRALQQKALLRAVVKGGNAAPAPLSQLKLSSQR